MQGQWALQPPGCEGQAIAPMRAVDPLSPVLSFGAVKSFTSAVSKEVDSFPSLLHRSPLALRKPGGCGLLWRRELFYLHETVGD